MPPLCGGCCMSVSMSPTSSEAQLRSRRPFTSSSCCCSASSCAALVPSRTAKGNHRDQPGTSVAKLSNTRVRGATVPMLLAVKPTNSNVQSCAPGVQLILLRLRTANRRTGFVLDPTWSCSTQQARQDQRRAVAQLAAPADREYKASSPAQMITNASDSAVGSPARQQSPPS